MHWKENGGKIGRKDLIQIEHIKNFWEGQVKNELDVKAAAAAWRELCRARDKHGTFNSDHEGYAVIMEELDELWDEIKKKKDKRNRTKLLKEVVQVAAMSMRFASDLCPEELEKLGGKNEQN